MNGGSRNSSSTDAAATTPRDATAPDDASDRLKRKRQPRNSACQGCAQLKMKCIATANGRCERCERMDRECIPTVPKPRKRHAENGNGNNSSDSAQSMMSFPAIFPIKAATSTAPPRPPSRYDPTPAPVSPAVRVKEPRLPRLSISSNRDSQDFQTLFWRGLGSAPALEDLLRGIDYNFVSNSFIIFRQLSGHFPFVELHRNADVVSMVAQRPVLTIAICSVAAASRPDVQDRLSEAFRYALATKVIFGGERSIDLLTGLLVYLAWNHHFMEHQQVYQLMCLLAGMATDLGLYRPLAGPSDSITLERDRAFVGCYYICTGLAGPGFDKPNPLRWTDNLRRCANSAADVGTLVTDHVLNAIIELCHCLDTLEEGLQQDIATTRAGCWYSVELLVKSTSQRLKALKREHTALAGSPAFAAANIHIHYRLLQATESPEATSLIQCAVAIKEFLDDFRNRPSSTLHHIAIVDWTMLLEILVLMASVAKSQLTAGAWESGSLSAMLQPDATLDALCAHAAAASADDPLAPRQEALLRTFVRLCDGIKARILHDRNGHGGVAPQGHPRDSPDARDAFRLLRDGVLHANFWAGLMSA